MLPPFYLGQYPATEIDYGLCNPSDLDNARGTLLLILEKVDEGRRARAALDLLRRMIADSPTTKQEQINKLTSTLCYRYDNEIDAKSDLSWVPISVFLGLLEHLSSQSLAALRMSRKASHQAFASLWSRPLNHQLQEDYLRLCTEHFPWAQKFHDELHKFIPTQSHTRVANPYTLSAIHESPVQIGLNYKSHAAAFSTLAKRKRGPKDLNQLDGTLGTGHNFKLTTKSSICRSASSLVGDSEPREKFRRVENDFPFAATLLTISTIWGGKALPRMMYACTAEPRKRWSSQGEIEEVYLEPDLQFEEARTTAAIQYLRSSDLLTLDSNEDGYERLSVDPSLQQYLEQQLQHSEQLKIRALMLICHLFPGDKEIEPLKHEVGGKLQLRPLQCVVAYIPELLQKKLLSTQQQHDVIATLLESSNFSDPSFGSAWKFQALRIADEMLVTCPDESLETYAAIRRKALSRLVRGTIYEEPSSLLDRRTTTPKSNFLHWKLRLSRAQDCIHRDDFAGAQREVSQFTAASPTKLSTLERRLGKEVRFEYARFVYLAGNFTEAKRLFEQELQAIDSNQGEKLHDSLISYLAGVHCELGSPAEAVRLTKSTFTCSQDGRGHSRLHISLAEALLHLGMATCTFEPRPSMDESARMRLSEAKDICERVLHRYRSNPNFDMAGRSDKVANVDRINYLRVTTVAARVSLLEAVFDNGDFYQALCDWVAVSEAIKKCGWAKPGFMEAISHLTIGAIEICRGESIASERDVRTAFSLLEKAGRRHLVVGLGVIWPKFTENLRIRNGGCPAEYLNGELGS